MTAMLTTWALQGLGLYRWQGWVPRTQEVHFRYIPWRVGAIGEAADAMRWDWPIPGVRQWQREREEAKHWACEGCGRTPPPRFREDGLACLRCGGGTFRLRRPFDWERDA